VTGLIATLILATPGRAAPVMWEEDAEFREAVKRIAVAIREKGKTNGDEAPTIKYPRVDTDQPTLPGGSELGIEAALRQLLEQNNVKLAEAAPIGLHVTYRIDEEVKGGDPEAVVKILVLEFVVEGDGKAAGNKYQAKVHNTGLILATRGMPAQLIAPGVPQSAENHAGKLQEVLGKGTGSALLGSQVLAEEGGPFGLEIRVDGKALPPARSPGGLAYVDLKKGQKFTIVLYNRSGYEAVASVAIDGVDVCHFGEEREKEGANKGNLLFRPLWLVPARKSSTIKGWYRTLETSDEFLAVEEKESARSALGYNGLNTHCVTATFYRAWEKGKEPPDDEPGGGKGTGDVGVGLGSRIADHKELVEREVGKLHSIITVRYLRPRDGER
jgi:hypothetical protein